MGNKVSVEGQIKRAAGAGASVETEKKQGSAAENQSGVVVGMGGAAASGAMAAAASGAMAVAASTATAAAASMATAMTRTATAAAASSMEMLVAAAALTADKESATGYFFVSDKTSFDADGGLPKGGPIWCCPNAIKADHICMFALCYGCQEKRAESSSDGNNGDGKGDAGKRRGGRRGAGDRNKKARTADPSGAATVFACNHGDVGTLDCYTSNKDFDPKYLAKQKELRSTWPPRKCDACNRMFIKKGKGKNYAV